MSLLDNLKGVFNPAATDMRRAREEFSSVRVPDKSELQQQLEQLVLAGELRPEELETILQGPSAYEEISTDPRLRGAQTDTLGRLREIADAGGLDARARLGLADALETQATETRGQDQAIMARARARGIGGSDLEMLNRMVAQQGAAQRGSRAALEQAAIGEQRKMDALQQGGALAGSIRAADFGEASTKANAQDAISRYNAANAQSVAQTNVANRNNAQAMNLSERQRVSDTNVGNRNDANLRTANLPLQIFGMQRGLAQDLSGARQTEGAAESAAADRIAKLFASGGAAYAASDERVKEDVESVDSSQILRDLNGYTFQYKGDPSGAEHTGTMAQDMEKGPLAGAVHEDPSSGTKMIDYGSMGFESGESGGFVMAILSDINKRLEELGG